MKQYLDHRALQKLIDATPEARQLLADPEAMNRIEPLAPAIVPDDAPSWSMGYMATPDGRIALRWCHSAETQEKFGRDALTAMEAVILTQRIAQLFDIEQAAMDAQRDVAILTKALQSVRQKAQSGHDTDSILSTIRSALAKVKQ